MSKDVRPLAGKHPVVFPYDDPQVVLQAIENARKELEFIWKGLDVLQDLYETKTDEETTA